VNATNVNPVAVPGLTVHLDVGSTSTSLDGTKSYDPDGTIVAFLWTFVSGPDVATIISPSAAFTDIALSGVSGTYKVNLTVTDNNGATDTKMLTIIVKAATLHSSRKIGIKL